MDNDHDLLIRLDENVRNLTLEVKKLGDDSIKKLNTLEASKLDRSDFDTFKLGLEKELARIESERKSADRDNEVRMRAMEKFMYIAIGVVTILDLVAIPLILKYLMR